MAINQRRNGVLSYIVAMLLIILTIVVTLVRFNSNSGLYDNSIIDLISGWTTEDEKNVSLSDLPKGKVTLTYDTSEIDLMDKALCLKSTDTFIDVYLFDHVDSLKEKDNGDGYVDESAPEKSDNGGRNIYHYAPDQPSILGKSCGSYVHVIPLPPKAGRIEITLTPIYKGDTSEIQYASIEDPSRFITYVYRKGLPEFIACLIMVLFGILMLLLETTGGSGFTGQPLGFVSLGAFSFLIGLWSMNDTFVPQLITEKPEIINYISDLCIILLAYPLVSFTATAVKKRGTPLLRMIAILTAVNLILTLMLPGLGISDPHYMQLFSRINIILAIAANVYLIITAIRNKSIESGFVRTIIIGMAATMAGFSTDFLLYLFSEGNKYDSGTFSRSGAIIFIILVGIYLLRENSRVISEHGKTELMKKMAYSDALTELPNRAAYYEKEASLQKSKQNCTIAMLDINCLKTVNDEHGHAEGDKHIKAAARIINDSLSKLGTCYRVGGDEFAAVLDTDDTQAIENALNEMKQAEEAYNLAEMPPVPLHIAYGYTIYAPNDMTLESAENTADNKMYDMKRIMKATH